MIEHVYRRAAAARNVTEVIVATDDQRIADVVTAFGGTVRMTRVDHRTGTDRLAEVATQLSCDIMVNVQGDVPMLDASAIEDVVSPLLADRTLQMSTVCTPIVDEADYRNPNVVKVVRNRAGDALYFSRAPLPHWRNPETAGGGPAFKHIGLYAYRRDFVGLFASLPPTPLEIAESLEQLRALEHGYRIHAVVTSIASVEVDTPEDLERVRRLLAASTGT